MRAAVGVAVSGLFFWLILKTIPLSDLLVAVRAADVGWILISLAFFILGYACRIWRWRLMLASYNPELGWGRCSVPFMASIAANNVLPFRAGDALRAVAFSGWLGVPTARVLATLLAERLMDLLSLLLALALTLTVFSFDGGKLDALFGWSASFFVLVTVAVALVLVFPGILHPVVRWLVSRLSGRAPALAAKLDAQVNHLFETLKTLAQRSRMVVLLAWSFLAWSFEACVFYAVARALPDITTPAAAWFAMPVGTLSTLLPSTPGYIGTFHYFVMEAARSLDNPEIAAAAFAVLAHLALYVPATLWGGLSFGYWVLTRANTGPASSEKVRSR
ncbi:lysylphosphatidylglycerol synthase transmembrane domain-containing protein [Aliisedimentitalea scapharcae]|uniref:Lysylphosphatidylglycerol synthase transmembrane domain-containing protein n=1 Tax=Aliisedimentitalea scapharcae TaxID=1524259 RepID=A0ABZ2XPL1_9RHOB